MNVLSNGLSQCVELVISESGLATLMPCWETLEGLSKSFELSDCPRLINQEDSAEASRTARTLVIIHAYDPESLSGLLKRFKDLEILRDLVITTDTQDKARRINDIHLSSLGGVSRLRVEVIPNHGRDVWPFWRVLEKFGEDYDYFLKLHLKRSTHWEELGYWNESVEGKDAGTAWNDDCFDCLIPSSDAECQSILDWMTDQRLGALFPRPHRVVARFGWSSEQNMVIVSQILAELGCDPLTLLRPLLFPAGNMFWGTMASFLPLVPYFVEHDHYPPEPVALDGTFLHAVERCYSYLLAPAGYAIGFLFPPLIGAAPPRLRGVELERSLLGNPEGGAIIHLPESVQLQRLYTSAAREWFERSHRTERDLLCLKDVIRSVERSRWGKIKASIRTLLRQR
jgi:lipopolysaccharide biosynthesis protein